jgi:hypothetical protein
MGKALGKRGIWSLCGVLAGVLMTTAAAKAEVTSDLSASVVVWPKVVSNELRDTVIQIANTSNNLVHVHCFYVDASPLFPDQPVHPIFNPRRWQETDFLLWLTRQQPYHWVASQGRPVNPTDDPGDDGYGLDAGAVPPVAPDFEGELKCVQVDASGIPFGGNNLKGEAVLRRVDGDVSKYSAIGILANPDLANAEPSRELRLDNTETSDGEYNSCPNTLLFNHFADGAPDPAIVSLNPSLCGSTDEFNSCPIRTELTLVPCSQDFENQIPSTVTVQFALFNEFEQEFSGSTSVECWENISIGDLTASQGICSEDSSETCLRDEDCRDEDDGFCVKSGVFSFSVLGTTSAYTRIQPVDRDGGVIGIAEEFHLTPDAANPEEDPEDHGSAAAFQLQQEGSRFDATAPTDGGPVVDTIVIPEI